MFAFALALSVLVTLVNGKTTKEENLQAHIETLRELVKAQAQRIEELEASESHRRSLGSDGKTEFVAGPNGQICDTVCKNIGTKCIPFKVPTSKGDVEAAFKEAGVYAGQGCKVTDMRSGSHSKLSIWYRTVDKSSSVYGNCYAYAGSMTHCTDHGSSNSDGNLCMCSKRQPKEKPDGKDCMDIYVKNPAAKDGIYTSF